MTNPFKDGPSGSTTPDKAAIVRPLSEVIGPGAGLTHTEQAKRHSEDIPPYTKPEVVESAAEKAALVKADRAAALHNQQREDFMALVGNLESLDWKNVKPHIMAQILTKIPYKGKRDDPPYFLSLTQALIFAMEAYRMGLSPLSDQCFFNRDAHKVNATLSGKKAMARDMGLNFGPPKFERVTKPFATGKSVAGFKEDVGYKCSMEVRGFADRAEYTAYLSEWYVSTSPVWREKPEHMLQTRAQEKAISSASGVGASEMPSPHDIEPIISGPPMDIPSFTQEEKV